MYISKVKALLGKELHLENGNSNGYTNGSHKDGEEANMDVQEEEEAMKSPTGSKVKGGRRSKSSSDTKS